MQTAGDYFPWRRFGERCQERVSRTITVIRIFVSQRRRSFFVLAISERVFWKRLFGIREYFRRDGAGTPSSIKSKSYSFPHTLIVGRRFSMKRFSCGIFQINYRVQTKGLKSITFVRLATLSESESAKEQREIN